MPGAKACRREQRDAQGPGWRAKSGSRLGERYYQHGARSEKLKWERSYLPTTLVRVGSAFAYISSQTVFVIVDSDRCCSICSPRKTMRAANADLLVASYRIDSLLQRSEHVDMANEMLAEVRTPPPFIVGGTDRQVLTLNRGGSVQFTCEKDVPVGPGAGHLFEGEARLDEGSAVAGDWGGLLLH